MRAPNRSDLSVYHSNCGPLYLSYFGQALESKKKVAGILAHVCHVPNLHTEFRDSSFFLEAARHLGGRGGGHDTPRQYNTISVPFRARELTQEHSK